MRGARWPLRAAALAPLGLLALPGAADARPVAGSLSFVSSYADEAGGVNGLGGASGIAVSPDASHVYVTGAEDDAIAIFERTGAGLAFVESDTDGEVEEGVTIDGLDGATGVAVSPDGQHVYVTADRAHSVATFARSPSTGELRFLDLDRDGAEGVDGLAGARAVVATPDGTGVHAAGFEDNAVASFSRDPENGQLQFLEFDQVQGFSGPFSVAASPDSTGIYATGFISGHVVSFQRNPGTGMLDLANVNGNREILWYQGPVSTAVSPYGRDVYVAALRNSAVNRFRVAPTSAALSFEGFVKDGVAGADGIASASGVAISPDATSAYATGAADDALAFFSITDSTGALRFRDAYRQGDGAIDGLEGAAGVAVAPDGRRAYAIANGAEDDTLTVFARQPAPLLDPARARSRQRLRGLRAVVRCSRSCELSARARGKGDDVRFSSGGLSAGLADDVRERIRFRFHPAVLRRLRGEHAEVRIKLKARDRLGSSERQILQVQIVP